MGIESAELQRRDARIRAAVMDQLNLRRRLSVATAWLERIESVTTPATKAGRLVRRALADLADAERCCIGPECD